MNDTTIRTLESLSKLRLPELQAKYAELVGEKARSPNKKHLLTKIAQALEAREQQTNAEPTKAMTMPEPTAAKVKLTKLSVAELQTMHREVIGRDTTSTDSAYLVWRLRQAQKGRVRVGPIERRSGGTSDVKVLPLRMTAAEVEALDEAWRRLGFKSRTAMIRKAIDAMLG